MDGRNRFFPLGASVDSSNRNKLDLRMHAYIYIETREERYNKIITHD